jgi:hypothetical protein
MDETRLDIINNDIDKYLPIPNVRQFVERDLVGSMLLNGSIKTQYKLYTDDFMFARLRGLYKYLINLSDENGLFNQDDLLTDNIDRNKYILNLMNNCINENIAIKSRWLVQQ